MQLPAGVRADYSREYEQAINEANRQEASQFAEAGARAGLNPDHVYEAMQPVNRDQEVVVGEIDEIPFISTRVQTGAEGSDLAHRGGLEWMAPPPKVGKKGTTMTGKQDMAETGDEGGKGGIWTPEEYRGQITPEWRRKAIITHAVMHNINGYSNPTATDIGTFPPDMNIIVEAVMPYSSSAKEAYAAVSGAEASHGGVPDFQLDTTGLGASSVLEEYLLARKEFGGSDDEIAEKLRNDIQLLNLVQALGKASMPFVRNLPCGSGLAGAMEYAGGVYDPNRPLDPEEIIRLAKMNGLAKGSAKEGQLWLAPNVSTLWKQQGDIVVPAFDKDQVDGSDVRDMKAKIILEIANGGVTPDGHKAAYELGIDVISGVLANMGGTVGSSKRGRMLLYGTYKNLGELKQSWHSDMHRIPRRTFKTMYQLRQERGEYVSPDEVIFLNIARKAVERRKAVRNRNLIALS